MTKMQTNSLTYVAVTDQAGKQICVYDLDVQPWDASRALRWRWSADQRNGFNGLTHAWGLPTDAKIRRCDRWDGPWMVVTDSLGLAAIVAYPAGTRKWGLNVGGNPHSAELLPCGNIAVAASTGGWLRVYASSQGLDAQTYAEYAFPGAHGVEWDAKRQVLWAVGDDRLVALEIHGSADAPQIREVHQAQLPTSGGHDLQPVYGSEDRLWISTRTNVYQYNITADQFDKDYPGCDSISRAHVKSVGNTPSGLVISAAADGVLRPETGSSHNDWCTDSIDGFRGGRSLETVPDKIRYRLPGVALYKARVWIRETMLQRG